MTTWLAPLCVCSKKEREAKKFSKQVAAERKKDRAQDKKAAITGISKLRKQREKSVSPCLLVCGWGVDGWVGGVGSLVWVQPAKLDSSDTNTQPKPHNSSALSIRLLQWRALLGSWMCASTHLK